MNSICPIEPIRGRGARLNIDHRFTRQAVVLDDEELAGQSAPETQVTPIRARSIISRNTSPDIGFNLSINPYQGCEHGCVYCYARPSHAFHDLSPGLDFETRIMAKVNAAELLEKELLSKSYRCEPIAIGVNTDAYQPAERELKITRDLLETCLRFHQPVMLITKSRLILRDTDLLVELAAHRLVKVSVSVTTLDNELKRRLEPRTAGPSARLQVIGELAAAGVPVNAMVAPVIPRINDQEIEHIIEAVAQHGAQSANYVLLRLPLEVEPLFRDWLTAHYPDRARAVMKMIKSCNDGKTNRSAFFTRMRGSGQFADLIAQRFRVARQRAGLDGPTGVLNVDGFRRAGGPQLSLF